MYLKLLIKYFQNTTILLSIIGTAAIVLSVVSYEYSLTVSAQAAQSASEQIHTNAMIQSFDLSHSVENKIDDIRDTLQVLAHSKGIQEQSADKGISLMFAAQDGTKELTSGYFWLDKNGIFVTSTTIVNDPQKADQYKNYDLSFRSYFTEPKRTLKPFFTQSLEPVDKGPSTLFLSYPIIASDGSFQGIVGAGMLTETLGNQLAKELSPEMKGTVGLLDKEGVILYTSDTQNIGKQVFSEEYQAYTKTIYSQVEAEKLNTFVTKSLHSEETGSADIQVSGGPMLTIASSPILLDSQHVATLYVAEPHIFSSTISEIIVQQQFISIAESGIIAAIAIGIAFVIISWNKNLTKTVNEKTAELNASNERLTKSYKQLEQSEALQREFVNIAAHELRTPIQPLLGVANILEYQFRDGGKDVIAITKPEVDMIIRNAQRLERLSSDILQVSRIESKSLTLRKGTIDLEQIIKSAIEDAQESMSYNKPIRIIFDGTHDSPAIIEADKEKIFEVLTNLLSNAIKFTEDGTITFRCEIKDDMAQVSVGDTGSGIDDEIMPKLFSKFATKSESGTGLGLYISKSIVEAHGGKIWAQNNANGKGATFFFTLPLSNDGQINDHTAEDSQEPIDR